jgi:hypothetical protein
VIDPRSVFGEDLEGQRTNRFGDILHRPLIGQSARQAQRNAYKVRDDNVQSGIVRNQVIDYFLLVNDIRIQYSTVSKCRQYVRSGFPGAI